MQFQNLISDSETLSGNIGVVFADDEQIISAIIEILKQTNSHVTLYNIKDPTELIRSYNVDGAFLNRIHLRTFDDKESVYQKCADDLKNSSINILMKGNVSSSEILSFILKHKSFIDKNNFLNHIACFEIPSYHKMLMISDVAFNIEPNINERIKMIKNIESFSKNIGYNHLNIGLLSSIEKPSNKIPSSIDAAEISKHFSDDKFVNVEGPFAFDNAIDRESAIEKGIESEIAGNLDALIVPYLDVGNALYKSLTYFAHAKVASLILGTTFPVILTSRSDTVENKVNSAILALRTLI